MIVSWPSGVPWCPARNSTRGGPQDVRASFQPEVGPAIERPRATASIEVFDITMSPWTVAQLQTFEAWFRSDLARGARTFLWYHPLTKLPTLWRFAPGEQPYTLQQTAKGYVIVSFKAVGLPAPPWFAPYVPAGTLLIPDLVLDFAGQSYGMWGERQSFAQIVTFARAGSANYVDKNGVTQSAAANVPRFDHDPTTHAPLGLLMDDTDGDSALIGPAIWPEGLFASAGTMLVIVRSQQVSAPTYRNAFAATGAATTDRVDVLVTQSAAQFRAVAGGVNQAVNGHGAYTLGSRIRIAAAFGANSFRSSRDGGAVVTDASGTMPTVDRATIGQAEDRIRIEKILCWNQALDDATLQVLSA
jgi:hypothetical protein